MGLFTRRLSLEKRIPGQVTPGKGLLCALNEPACTAKAHIFMRRIVMRLRRAKNKRGEEPLPLTPAVRSALVDLEHELQAELEDSWISEARVGARDGAERAAAAVEVRDIEV